MRRATVVLGLVFSVVLAYGATAVSGHASAEHALRQFDQNLMDAWEAKLPEHIASSPRVDGYVVERRVPLALVSYYRGQSTVEGREVSCAARKSVVLWYGKDALLLWQDGLWLPDRPAVHRRFAESGILR